MGKTTSKQKKEDSGLHYDVKIQSIRPEGTLRATATVNINNAFAIRGIKLMEGSKGLFVSMPSYKAGNGEYKDICFPCSSESRKEFDQAVPVFRLDLFLWCFNMGNPNLFTEKCNLFSPHL